MARYSIAGRSTVAGTTLRAVASLFAVASRTMKLREVGVFNTTSTALAVSLVRFTNATGVGAGLTEVAYDEAAAAPNGTGFAGHTADGAVGSAIRQASLPPRSAAASSGLSATPASLSPQAQRTASASSARRARARSSISIWTGMNDE